MPLPKPDIALIKHVMSQRLDRLGGNDILRPIQDAVLIAIGDGSINAQRAANVAWALELHPESAKVFPHRELARALEIALAPGGWNEQVEHDLLVFMYGFYSSYEVFEEAIWSMMTEPLHLFGDIYPAIYDDPQYAITLDGKICDFTGSFACGPRRWCFTFVAEAGGAASDGRYGTDYLFVAQKHIDNRVLSSAIISALLLRAQFGVPMILPERCFPGNEAPKTNKA